MNQLLLAFILSVVTPLALSHSGEDPSRELGKKRSYIHKAQQEFKKADSQKQRLSNLKKQITNLQGTVLILKNTLAKENSAFRTAVSQHGVDYLAELKTSLKDMDRLLDQIETVTPL